MSCDRGPSSLIPLKTILHVYFTKFLPKCFLKSYTECYSYNGHVFVHLVILTFLTFIETISTSLWASLYHHIPVLSVFSYVSCQFVFGHIFSVVVDPSHGLGRPLLLFPVTSMSITFLAIGCLLLFS